MTGVIAVCAAAVAAAGACRSTWSPCGISMLATITPLAEQARGHRYRSTAAWFVVGAVAGGASLGLCLAVLAAAVGAAGASGTTLVTIAGAAAVVAAAADARLAGFRLPFHRRQVNEQWLDQFRPWVYGFGFGWQIGTGLVTYIKTSAVYLMVALAALTGDPWLALSVGVLFGLVRGLAVLLGRGITSATALARFHRRFTEFEPFMAGAVVTVDVAATVALASLVSPWVALVVAALAGAIASWAARASRPTRPGGSRSARTA
jgi:hypothetical protein